MEIFSALLAFCAENSPVTGEFLSQKPVTRSFDVFLDLRLNKRVNNREAGALRRYRAHYDVTVMFKPIKGAPYSALEGNGAVSGNCCHPILL